MTPLRVVAVSHAAVVDINQEPFAALAAAGATVTVMAPRALETDIRGRVELRALAGTSLDLVPLDVALGGNKQWAGGQRGIHLIVYRGLERAIAQARPDVLFIEEEPYSLAAWQCARIARRLGIPYVVHENQNILRPLPPPFGLIRRRVLAGAAGVTVRNQAATALLRALRFDEPIHEFPHGVDVARYEAGTPRSADLPRPVFGFVGRLVPEKGILDLIEALAMVRGGSLLVVGDGPLLDAADEAVAARSIPHRFLGALPHHEVPDWYGAMDIVVIPSCSTATWKEQFGRIVIEANAAAKPVVVTDSGELGETVRATGGGVIVPEGDVRALADALRSLSRDRVRCVELGEAGRAAVTARFTPQAIGAALFAFLEKVAAR